MDAQNYNIIQPQMVVVNTNDATVPMQPELALSPENLPANQQPLLQQLPQQTAPVYQQPHASPHSYIQATTPTLQQQSDVTGAGLIQPVQPIYQPHQISQPSQQVAQHMHPIQVQHPVPYAHHPLISSIALQHAMRTNPQMMPLSYKPSPIHYNQSANADLTFRNVPVPVNNKRVTDQTGCDVEKFLVNTLRQNQRDRFTIYTLETEMIGLCTNTHLYGIRFPKMTSYHRMLVHRIATYFGLDHNVDDSGRQVVCHKGPNTRIPLMRLRDLVVMADHADAVRCGYAQGPSQMPERYFSPTPQSSTASQQNTPRDPDGVKERKPSRGMNETYNVRKVSPRPRRSNQKPIHEGYPHPSAFYPNYPYIHGHYVAPPPQMHAHPREMTAGHGQNTGLLPQPYPHGYPPAHSLPQYPQVPPPAYSEGVGYLGHNVAVTNAALSGNNVVVQQPVSTELGLHPVFQHNYPMLDPVTVPITVSTESSEEISPRVIDQEGDPTAYLAKAKALDQNGGGSPHSSESVELDEKSSKPEQDQHLEQQKEQDAKQAAREERSRAIALAQGHQGHPYYPQHQNATDCEPKMHNVPFPGQHSLHVLPSGIAQQLAMYVQQQHGYYRAHQAMQPALIPVEDVHFRIKFHQPADVRRIEAELALNFLQRQYGGTIYWNGLDGTRENRTAPIDKKLSVEHFQIYVILPSTVVGQVHQEIASKNFVLEQLAPAVAVGLIFGKVEAKPKRVLPVVVPGGEAGVADGGVEALAGNMASVKLA